MNIQLSEKNKLMHIDSFPPPEFKFDSFTVIIYFNFFYCFNILAN